MVTDERVYADIQILMRFFGMLIGYVSYAKDIRLNIEGKDLKTWIWFNEDFSHNLRHLNGIDRFRTEYSQVKDELANYFENWYTFSNDDYFFCRDRCSLIVIEKEKYLQRICLYSM